MTIMYLSDLVYYVHLYGASTVEVNNQAILVGYLPASAKGYG